jgi:hypothetical protein
MISENKNTVGHATSFSLGKYYCFLYGISDFFFAPPSVASFSRSALFSLQTPRLQTTLFFHHVTTIQRFLSIQPSFFVPSRSPYERVENNSDGPIIQVCYFNNASTTTLLIFQQHTYCTMYQLSAMPHIAS